MIEVLFSASASTLAGAVRGMPCPVVGVTTRLASPSPATVHAVTLIRYVVTGSSPSTKYMRALALFTVSLSHIPPTLREETQQPKTCEQQQPHLISATHLHPLLS